MYKEFESALLLVRMLLRDFNRLGEMATQQNARWRQIKITIMLFKNRYNYINVELSRANMLYNG
jgi:uncharacterized protein YeeX (DUF496 family)